MDVPLLKQFVIWRGEKRIVVGDVQTSKISSVFKVRKAIDLTLLQSEQVKRI